MLTFNDKTMIYDNNGNMTSITNSCGTTTYIWDARNRLIGINGFNSDCSVLTASFKYDTFGRRIEKTINGKTTNYLYDGMDIVQEIENGTVTANYIRTLNIDEPLARIKSDGTVRYYQQDALGSVIALTDETGTIKTQYIYDPYGDVTISGEASDNPFQYAGRENDNTGLLYERFRYYSFELQRYISEDPIGFAGGDVNFYGRVKNNPVNFKDPLGLDCRSVGCIPTSFWHEVGRSAIGDWKLFTYKVEGPTLSKGGPVPLTYTLQCDFRRKIAVASEREITCTYICIDGCSGAYLKRSSLTESKEKEDYEPQSTCRTFNVFDALAYIMPKEYCVMYMTP